MSNPMVANTCPTSSVFPKVCRNANPQDAPSPLTLSGPSHQ